MLRDALVLDILDKVGIRCLGARMFVMKRMLGGDLVVVLWRSDDLLGMVVLRIGLVGVALMLERGESYLTLSVNFLSKLAVSVVH